MSTAPATIPLWFFDESSGLWKQEGQATRQAGKYIGMVNHFTFWTVSFPADYVMLSMKIINSSGNAVGGARVQLSSLTFGDAAYDFTDNLGYIDGFAPKNEILNLEIFDNCNQAVYAQNLGTLNVDTDLGNLQLNSGISLRTVSGSVTDCNGSPLAFGTVQIILDGNRYEFATVDNGNFIITFLNCSNTNDVQITAIDESNLQSGSPFMIRLTDAPYDLGSISACGINMPAFFDVYIDGVEQYWPVPVFGGGVSSNTWGDWQRTPVLELFKGDTSNGLRRQVSLVFNIFSPGNADLPVSVKMPSISEFNPAVMTVEQTRWYQAVDQESKMVKVARFGGPGKIMEGSFSEKFQKLLGCCPESTILDTVTVEGVFRLRNEYPWWIY